MLLALFKLKLEKRLQAAHVKSVVDWAGADRATVEDNRLGVRLHSEVAWGHRVFANLAQQRIIAEFNTPGCDLIHTIRQLEQVSSLSRLCAHANRPLV